MDLESEDSSATFENGEYYLDPYVKLKRISQKQIEDKIESHIDISDLNSNLNPVTSSLPVIIITPPRRSSITKTSPVLSPISEENVPCHLDKVRSLTEKLQLKVRRPSILEWRARQAEERLRCMQKKTFNNNDVIPSKCHTCLASPCTEFCAKDSSESSDDRIGNALSWLRQELFRMRAQDEELARTFIKLRTDLHALKLQRCSAEHQALLDDAIDAEEEQREPSYKLSDSVPEALSPTLRNYGLTRMNITARRFSVF